MTPLEAPPPFRRMRRVLTSARSIAASYAGVAGESVVFLLLTPFLVRRLGLGAYGLYRLGVALVEWLQLLDLGLREAVIKHVADHQTRSEAAAVRRLADTALFVHLIAGAVAIGAVVAFSAVGLPYLVKDPADLARARPVLVILGVSAALSLPAAVGGTLLEGLARFDLVNLLRLGTAMARLVLIVTAIQLDLDLVGVAVADLAATVGLHAARWWAVHRLDPLLVPRPWPHREEMSRLLGFGVWAAIRQATDVVIGRFYEPVYALFASPRLVGALYAGKRFATLPAALIVPMTGVLLPLSSELNAAGRGGSLARTLLSTTKMALVLALPTSLVVGLGAAPIQDNWLGGRVREVERVMELFSLVFLVVATLLPANAILLGLGRVRLLAVTGLLQVGIIAVLALPLTARLGIDGLALTGLACALFQLAIELPAAARACGVPGRLLMRRALLPPLLAGAAAALLMWRLRYVVGVGGLAALGAWASGGLAVYGTLLWWWGFDGEERAFLWGQVERLLRGGQTGEDGEE